MQTSIVLHNSISESDKLSSNQADDIYFSYQMKNNILTIQFDVSYILKTERIEGIDHNNPSYIDKLNTRIDYRKDFLWESTCFELFIKPKYAEITNYLELNIAPSGYWNVYHFDYYRTPNLTPPRQANIAPILSISSKQPVIKETAKQTVNQLTCKASNTSSFIISINIDFAVITNFFDKSTTSAQHEWLVNFTSVIKLERDKTDTTNQVGSLIDNQYNYYANKHAQPEDFHNTEFWYDLANLDDAGQ